jgi:hypothetical protein
LASSYPAPTRVDHQRFCEREGWSKVRDARGKTGTHHVTFELATPDGRVLRTRISHPVNRSTYGASMWKHILRDQLDATEGEFWDCVNDGRRPLRGQASAPSDGLPLALVHQLIHRLHLSEDEVRTMTKDEALQRLSDLWAAE